MGRPTYSYLTGTGFYNYATGFDKVYADALAGGADDKAYLYDSTGNDNFWAQAVDAVLSDGSVADLDGSLLLAKTFYNRASRFDRVFAIGTAGGTNDRNINRPIDFALSFSGSWGGDPWP